MKKGMEEAFKGGGAGVMNAPPPPLPRIVLISSFSWSILAMLNIFMRKNINVISILMSISCTVAGS